MGISDLYLSIGQRRNISHFANIVRIAKSDNKISTEEIEFLAKISKKYNISNDPIAADGKIVPSIATTRLIEKSYGLPIGPLVSNMVASKET